MNFTDFYFLCALAAVLIIYYIVPRRLRWGVILVSSIAYYMTYGHPLLALYPLLSVGLVYALTRAMEHFDIKERPLPRRICHVTGIILLLAVLISLKYIKFMWFEDALLIPLGLSYYTFTLIGYLTDVYNGIAVPQRNFLKLLAFGMYAPAMVSGPIMQYREISEDFFAPREFDLELLEFGFQRMLWGFFKKLVIAERLGVIVSAIYNAPDEYGGMYIWFGILCFTIQLYTDFSGLMDIVLGISQCLGLKLPENFDTPFFSKTVSEYWRRWHITLGVWFKEYVFYPLLRTKLHMSLQNALKKIFSVRLDEKRAKKGAKRISTYAAMFVLWLTVGLWHGGKMTFVLGSGLLHWFYIVMEEMLEPPFKRLWERLNIRSDGKPLNAVRIVRTFVLVNIGNAFFRAESVREALKLLTCGLKHHNAEMVGVATGLNYAISASGVRGLKELSIFGTSYMDMIILVISILILLVVDIAKTKTDVRAYIAARPIVVRYIVWLALLFYVILLGNYGPGYSAAEFIYQGF